MERTAHQMNDTTAIDWRMLDPNARSFKRAMDQNQRLSVSVARCFIVAVFGAYPPHSRIWPASHSCDLGFLQVLLLRVLRYRALCRSLLQFLRPLLVCSIPYRQGSAKTESQVTAILPAAK